MLCQRGRSPAAKSILPGEKASVRWEDSCGGKTVGICTWREKSMRRYEQDGKMRMAVCNKCGRALKVENGYLREFCFQGTAAFGYFSKKDGTMEHFDLCEDCYESLTAQFLVPVEEAEETELV